MKIRPLHRKKLNAYLKKFYTYFPEEKYTVFHFVKYLKKRLKNNRDAWIGVSGDTGTGKSLCVLMCMILFGRPMDLTKNVSYIPKGDEIRKKFLELNFNTFLVDEAAKEMRSVNWQSKAQQGVNVAAMTERFRNNAVFLCMPNFSEFTKSMRAGSIIFRAVIVYRTDNHARVIIQRKSRNWRSDDPWGDKRANLRYESIEKRKLDINNKAILEIERNLPNTVMDFIVPNLELILPDITTEYERLKIDSRNVQAELEAEAGTGKVNVYKGKYEKLLTLASQILVNNELDIGVVRTKKSDVAEALGVSMQTLNKFLKKDRKSFEPKNFRKVVKSE